MDFMVNKDNKHTIGVHIDSSGEVKFMCSDGGKHMKICMRCADTLIIALGYSLLEGI